MAQSRVRTRACELCGRRVASLACPEKERPLAGAVPFYRARTAYNQRGAACAGRKRACCASSRERASAVAQSRLRTRASGLCGRPQLARRSMTLHQRREASRWCSGLPKDINRLQHARSGARAPQARVSARATPPSHRERARWRDRVCAHAQTGCSSEAAAGTSEHGLAPEGRALAGAVPFPRAWTGYHKRGTARTRMKRACCACFRERASAVSRSRVRTRASELCERP